MRQIGKKAVVSLLVGALTVGSYSMTTLAAGRSHGANRQTADCTNHGVCNATGVNGCNAGICDGTGTSQVKVPRRAGRCTK